MCLKRTTLDVLCGVLFVCVLNVSSSVIFFCCKYYFEMFLLRYYNFMSRIDSKCVYIFFCKYFIINCLINVILYDFFFIYKVLQLADRYCNLIQCN